MTGTRRAGRIAVAMLVVMAALAADLAAPAGASAADTTPPDASAALPAHVTAANVVVGLVASDPESGVADVRLSNDGLVWSDWVPLPAPAPGVTEVRADLPWTLAPGLGAKTVSLEVRNGEGLVAAVAATTTVLLPTSLAVQTVPPVVVYGTACELRVVLSTAGAPVAGAGLSVLEQPAGAPDFGPPAVPFDATTTDAAGRLVLKPVRSLNTTYRLSWAGDGTLAPASADVLVRVRPRIVTRFPKSLWEGDTARLKGRVYPAHPGGEVTIERKVAGVWRDFRTVTLAADSTFNVAYKPTSWGFKYFRIRMAADAEHALAITTSRRVIVNRPNPHRIPMAYPNYFVVDYSEFRLYYYEHGRVVRDWPCVLGKPSTPTPLGHFKIYWKQRDPGYGMGPFKLLYYGSIGIHGTSEPWLLDDFPRAYSHGCTRLTNSHISWLFERVPVGTPVWNIP